MTKLLIPLFAGVLVLAACNKSSIEPNNGEVKGQVLYGGDRAASGIGYYILTDTDHETLSPQNLPAEFKHATVNAHIAFSYFDTGATLVTDAIPNATGPRVVVLRSIRNL
jgi:hypothetical protein